MKPPTHLRIHIIDDDPAISLLLVRLISSLGHLVNPFQNPTACPIYSQARCECPRELPCADVIISDIMMPKMDGIAFFKKQRQRGCKALDENKALMSASVTPQQQAAVDELGCHFIKKPFHISEIRQWLEDCAERSSKDRDPIQQAE